MVFFDVHPYHNQVAFCVNSYTGRLQKSMQLGFDFFRIMMAISTFDSQLYPK